MKLESRWQSVELRPVGYQFPDLVAAGVRHWDANWLQVQGAIRDGDAVWEFQDPCLTTWEARQLLVWLRKLAAGETKVGGRGEQLSFTEPNLLFEVHEETDTGAMLVVTFSHESAPPGSREGVQYGDYDVRLTLDAGAIGRAADEWERELAVYPER